MVDAAPAGGGGGDDSLCTVSLSPSSELGSAALFSSCGHALCASCVDWLQAYAAAGGCHAWCPLCGQPVYGVRPAGLDALSNAYAKERVEKNAVHVSAVIAWFSKKHGRCLTEQLAGRNFDGNARSVEGGTLAHFAADRGDAEGVTRLLRAGCHPDSVDLAGESALHVAAGGGHLDVLLVLAANGAELNAPNGRGLTPLIIAKAGRAKPSSSRAHAGRVKRLDAFIAKLEQLIGEHDAATAEGVEKTEEWMDMLLGREVTDESM